MKCGSADNRVSNQQTAEQNPHKLQKHFYLSTTVAESYVGRFPKNTETFVATRECNEELAVDNSRL